ncbi:MAG: hypothetical protein ABIH78_04785 [Candidatus Peregrinibacteria bacterium]
MKKIHLRYKIVFIVVFLVLLVFNGIFLIDYFSMKSYSRNNLIAMDHTNEAIDAIKSIRYKNLLLSPDDPNCWLELNPDENPGCAEKVTAGEHYILKETDNGWELVNVPGELNLDKETDYNFEYRLEVGCNEAIFYRDIEALEIKDSNGDGIENSAVFRVVAEWTGGRTIMRSLENSLESSFTLFN